MSSQAFNASQIVALPENQGFWSRDLVSTRDLNPPEVEAVLHLAGLMKTLPAEFRGALAGKQMAMFFEKPSLRTRLTFEAGMASLGGTTFFVDQTHERIDAREKLSDIAHNLERWVNAIVLRTFDQQTIEGMAEHACIPVINALSDLEHPCQGLTDYFTLQERFGDLKKICLAYVGDGNNVAHSLLLTCASLGSHIRLAAPSGYEPDAQIVADARSIARQTGATIECCRDPYEAVACNHVGIGIGRAAHGVVGSKDSQPGDVGQRQGRLAAGVGAQVQSQHLIARSGGGKLDADAVGLDGVQGGRRGLVDEIARAVQQQADVVGQPGHAGGVGADQVADHRIVPDGAIDLHAVPIAGDDVAGVHGRAADDVCSVHDGRRVPEPGSHRANRGRARAPHRCRPADPLGNRRRTVHPRSFCVTGNDG